MATERPEASAPPAEARVTFAPGASTPPAEERVTSFFARAKKKVTKKETRGGRPRFCAVRISAMARSNRVHEPGRGIGVFVKQFLRYKKHEKRRSRLHREAVTLPRRIRKSHLRRFS